MSELICIVCPNSCHLTVDGEKISGNKCKRGLDFAKNEITAPKRSVTTTVATAFPNFPALSVKTNGEIPKEKIFELISLLKKVKITQPLKSGDVILADVFGTGIDVIATKDIVE